MKKPIIKTKKTELIIYRDGYICLDGHCIIKADLVQLDDSLMQDKVNNDIPFLFNSYNKTFGQTVPDLLAVIPKSQANSYLLIDTNLQQQSFNSKKLVEAFYNEDLNTFIFFDVEYLKIFRDTKLLLSLRQSTPTSAATIYNDDLECLFVLMPCMIRDSFLHQIEHYLKPVEEVA